MWWGKGADTRIRTTGLNDGETSGGHGNFANDRPPAVGALGRETGGILEVSEQTGQQTPTDLVADPAAANATASTDE